MLVKISQEVEYGNRSLVFNLKVDVSDATALSLTWAAGRSCSSVYTAELGAVSAGGFLRLWLAKCGGGLRGLLSRGGVALRGCG